MIVRISLLFLLLSGATSINQVCSVTSDCPANSQCSSNGYCTCNSGFVGNCSTAALLLDTSQITTTLIQDTTALFYVVPANTNRFIIFSITLCQSISSANFAFTLWADDGNINTFTSSNSLSGPTTLSLGTGCVSVTTPYISFGSQPNGQIELLIIGINNQDSTRTAQLSISQNVSSGWALYLYFLVAIGGLMALTVVVVSFFILYRRRRWRRRRGMGGSGLDGNPPTTGIDHFDTHMPSFAAYELGPDRAPCSICLSEVLDGQTVRRTPCGHVFHEHCIDSWCKKNVSCPVCRQELDLESISKLTSSAKSSPGKGGDQKRERWEEMQLPNVQQPPLTPGLRGPMLG